MSASGLSSVSDHAAPDGSARIVPVGLGFVAGFVDTCGFVALFGLFTAHVTGNFVLIGAAVVQGGTGIWAKLAAAPSFIVAVACTSLFVHHCVRGGRDPRRPVLLAQIALLTGFAVVGWRLAPFAGADAAPTIATGLLGVAALGVQNAASRLLWPTLPPTTVMTGNVTQLVIDLVDLARGGHDQAAPGRVARMLPPVLAFTAGALGGGLLYAALGFACLALPVAVLIVLAARSS